MLTPGEVGATEAALDAARAEVLRAEEAAGSPYLDAFRWLWTAGSAQESAREAARSARALLDGCIAVRNRAVESPEEEHELALQVVEVANRLAKRGTAQSIEELEAAASYSTIVGNAARAALDRAKLLGVLLLVGAGVGAWLLYRRSSR